MITLGDVPEDFSLSASAGVCGFREGDQKLSFGKIRVQKVSQILNHLWKKGSLHEWEVGSN